MNAASATRDQLLPRPPDRRGAGLTLAVAVHVGLVVAIAFGVSWRSSSPAGLEAELWAAVPQAAAPRAVEPDPPPPPPPQPVRKAEPPPPPPKPAEPERDAQIAIEKAKAEKARQEKERLEKLRREEEEDKRRLALKREQEDAERRKREQQQQAAEQKKREQQQAEDRKRAEAEAQKRLEAERERNLQRILGQAGATGAPGSTGAAQRSAGPSAGYAGRIKARVLPNIVFPDSVPGNPTAEVEVRAAPDGTIIGRRLTRSSGVPAWDDAVLRAIDKTEVLPRDTDGSVPSPMLIQFRPRD